MKELIWVANYNNNEVFRQFDNGKENKYEDIDRERLVRFDLYDSLTDKPVYSLYIHSGRQLIFRKRNFIFMNAAPTQIVFIVGFSITFMTASGPKREIVLNYIHPDGSIALDDARSNIQLLPFET